MARGSQAATAPHGFRDRCVARPRWAHPDTRRRPPPLLAALRAAAASAGCNLCCLHSAFCRLLLFMERWRLLLLALRRRREGQLAARARLRCAASLYFDDLVAGRHQFEDALQAGAQLVASRRESSHQGSISSNSAIANAFGASPMSEFAASVGSADRHGETFVGIFQTSPSFFFSVVGSLIRHGMQEGAGTVGTESVRVLSACACAPCRMLAGPHQLAGGGS